MHRLTLSQTKHRTSPRCLPSEMAILHKDRGATVKMAWTPRSHESVDAQQRQALPSVIPYSYQPFVQYPVRQVSVDFCKWPRMYQTPQGCIIEPPREGGDCRVALWCRYGLCVADLRDEACTHEHRPCILARSIVVILIESFLSVSLAIHV